MSSRHSKPPNRDFKSGDSKDPGNTAGAKAYQKIAISGLPKIALKGRPNILHIRDALIQYCQRELGPISGIFLEGKYRSPTTASYDPAEIEAGKTGIMKDLASAKMKRAEVENELYEKSKIKLHGLLSGMTTREVDDRISTYRDSLKRIEFEEQPQSTKTSIQPLKTTDAKIDLTELECPLAL